MNRLAAILRCACGVGFRRRCAVSARASAEVSVEACRSSRGSAPRDRCVGAHGVVRPLARAITSRCGSTTRADLFETVPWVAAASVRRVWPDRLVVTLTEHRALGVWEDGRLLSDRGELFVANPDEAEIYGPLPEFSGPIQRGEGRRATLLRTVGAICAACRCSIAAIDISDRKAWSLRLAPDLREDAKRAQRTSR